MIRRRFAFVCLCVLIVAAAPNAWPQSPAVDAQGLVGQWSGSWTGSQARRNGQYHLTIERVEGEKVFGKGEAPGLPTSEFKVVGTLSGNKLTFGRTTLTVNGNRMDGEGPTIKITLNKVK